MASIANIVERWSSWLTEDGPISGTVLRLQQDRERWRWLREVVALNPAIPHADDTLGWFWYHYACDAAVRIRRLEDAAADSASLGRLLDEVKDRASSITRRWYLDRWRRRVDDDSTWELFHFANANDWFDAFAGAGQSALLPEIVERDKADLKQSVEPVRYYVNKRLAHHNPKSDPRLSYAEISAAIDTISVIYRRYVRLVHQVDPLPLADQTDWGAAFAVPWNPLGLIPGA